MYTLSPVIAKAPHIWFRYVDDVKRNDEEKTLDMLNQQHTNIKFTYEREREDHVTFLDLVLHRGADKVDIAIHHKETSTMHYIPSPSYTPIQQKVAASHLHAHRSVNLTLNS